MARTGPLREGRRAALQEALGVTRVARLTGLDRTGVEVAAAIRPGGHVLTACAGKGETWARAVSGALSETAELCGAERPLSLVHGTTAEQRARFGPRGVVGPGDLAPAEASPAWEGIRLAWRAADDLCSGLPCLVPAHAVHCPPPGSEPLGPAVVPWTSNGMGAHPRRDAALLHALLEACERDQLARALPHGFTPAALRARLLVPDTLRRSAPRTAAWVARLEGQGFTVHLLDATASLGLPCAAALLVDLEGGPVPLAAGYACRLGRDEALLAALLEAAQSRVTEIHGAREDVAAGDRTAGHPLLPLLARARPTRRASAMPTAATAVPGTRVARVGTLVTAVPGTQRARGGTRALRSRTDPHPVDPAGALALVLARLARAGVGRVAAADLTAPAGLCVVKVLVPGLVRSELLG